MTAGHFDCVLESDPNSFYLEKTKNWFGVDSRCTLRGWNAFVSYLFWCFLNFSSASKLDSKVTPAAAAEAKIGLKSSDSQPRGNGPTVTCSSTTTATAAAQPAITATAKSAALASSTGNAPRQDSIKKPVAQKSASVAPRDATKLSKEDEDECDPALSEALGQFFSEGKDAPANAAKPAIPPAKVYFVLFGSC